jgi:hypothetical protein
VRCLINCFMKKLLLIVLCHFSFTSSAIDSLKLFNFLDSVIVQNHQIIVETSRILPNLGQLHYFESNTDTVNQPDLIGVFQMYYDQAFGEIYKKNVNESPEEEIIVAFYLSPMADNKFELFVFDSNKLKLIGRMDIMAKYNDAEISFKRVSSLDHFDLVVEKNVLTTYVAEQVEIYNLNNSGLNQIYSVTTLFYDWKHYGKSELMELNNYPDTLSENQSRRVTTQINFVENTLKKNLDIVESMTNAIVIEPDEKENLEIKEYKIFKVINEEENTYVWDSANSRYVKFK